MAKYMLSEAADADLRDIAYFTFLHFGSRQAAAYGEGFDVCFEMIAENPKLGQVQDNIRLGLRRHVHQSHEIYYIETDEGILIVRILHERQEPGRHL